MRALVLSGGGSRGAFQAGVVRALAERGARWDVIAGVSVGALNAAFLAQHARSETLTAARELRTFWDNVRGNESVYRRWTPFGKLHSLWRGSLYSTEPLARTVATNLDPEKLRRSDVKLLVGAVCLETGEYRYVDGGTPDIREWVLASSAFPVAFPPRVIDGRHWIDGGVRDITPITDVLALGPDEIDVVLTAPLGEPMGSMPIRQTRNALHVALRSAYLMSDEVFNGDLDRVPEADRLKLRIYAPPAGHPLPDGLDFDPARIAELYALGLRTGA